MAKRNHEAIDGAPVVSKRARTDAAPLQSHPTAFSSSAPAQAPISPIAPPFCYWSPIMLPQYPWCWPSLMPCSPIMLGQMHVPLFDITMSQTHPPPLCQVVLSAPQSVPGFVVSPEEAIIPDQGQTLIAGQHIEITPVVSIPGVPAVGAAFWNMNNVALNQLIDPALDDFNVPAPDPLSNPEFDLMGDGTLGLFAGVGQSIIDEVSDEMALNTAIAFGGNHFANVDPISAAPSHSPEENPTSYSPCSWESAHNVFDNRGDGFPSGYDLDQAYTASAALQLHSFQSTKTRSPKSPSPTGKSSTEQWYRRFRDHDSYLFTAATITHISMHASAALAPILSSPPEPVAVTYAKYVEFMTDLRPLDDPTTIVSIVMHLFFYIADGPNARLWTTGERKGAIYRKRGGPELDNALYDAVQPHLSPPAHPDVATRAGFIAKIKAWRKVGSSYAFLARRLGLGALLCARELVHPECMWGCAQGRDKYGASETTLKYLENVVKIRDEATASGADDVMNGLMWDVFRSFTEFDQGVMVGEAAESAGSVDGGVGHRLFPGFGRASDRA